MTKESGLTPSSLIERYCAIVLGRRWLLLAAAILVMLALTAGARFVGVTNDYRSLFDDDDPHLATLNAFEDTYGASNRALVAVAPRNGGVFSVKALIALANLTDRAWQTPLSTRVDSLANLDHTRAEDDDIIVEPLVGDIDDLNSEDVERIREIALSEPELVDRLVSRDGQFAGITISFAVPENSDAAVIEITDHLAGLLTHARDEYPDIDFFLTGDVPMNRAFADATNSDLETLAPIVLLIIAAVSVVLLRSVLGMVSIIATLGFTIISTVGFAGWTGTVFNPANSGVPIIVMTVAIAHSVHIVSTTLLAMRSGQSRQAAIAGSVRLNAWPVFLTSLTTGIGFASLNFSTSPAIRDLGNLVAFGVLCAFAYSLTLLPVLLSVMPLRASSARSRHIAAFELLGDFVVRHNRTLLGCSLIVVVIVVTGIPRIDLTDNWTRYLGEKYEFRRDTDVVIQNLTGVELLEYSLESGSEGGITSPDYLRKVDSFAEWYRTQPEVRHVKAFSDLMKRLNRTTHGDDPAYHRLPDDPELAAQFLLLYELSLSFGRDLDDRFDIAKSATRMTVVPDSLTSSEQRALDSRAQGWIEENSPGLTDGATGVTIVFLHLSQGNIRSMLTGTIAAMTVISLILVLVFRNVRIGLVSLIPNFIPALLGFGLWGYLVGRVGLAGSVVTAIAFGIVVDDTIHFLTKYLQARRGGLSAAEAIRSTFRVVGHALWTTTAMLCLGFLVFAASGFEISWSLGLLVAMTIFLALVADFLLLPPILLVIDRDRRSLDLAKPDDDQQ